MAVSTDNAFSGPYLANGVTVVFPFTFQAPSAAEVGVLVRNGIGVEVDPGSYTVQQAQDKRGNVVFDVAPADGLTVTPILEPSFTQDLQFQNGSAWLAEPVNEGYDRAAQRDQALKRDVDRAMKAPIGSDGHSFTTSDRGIVGIFGGQFSVQPLFNILQEATDLVDDGVWGGPFTSDGVWG
ncbi:hypothetical protein [Novosphingobium resinovorum]|uniref:Uncharacterized protein n=1 Tax=Novosphingobium resinovorum TaxID=158500 RepID=A0A1D8A542_9SPHN|nr:hypothetical protein [Novosphingobium resinovorum]AOR77233.1 hypothetical protein BES08_11070 [Novosphingobium resinovorum]